MKKQLLYGLLLGLLTVSQWSSLTGENPSKASDLNDRQNVKRSKSCKTYDYIIVGAGASGAIIANEISANHNNKVLVLEAGVRLNDDPIVNNPDILDSWQALSGSPLYTLAYACPLFNPFEIFAYNEGRGWGGSTLHNYMYAVRGTPSIYDFWASASGNSSWSYDNLLPLMLGLENYTPDGTVADPTQRGTGGPISITQTPPVTADPLANFFNTAADVSFIPDYNLPSGVVGTSANQFFFTAGANSHRSFAGNAFLSTSVVNTKGKGVNGRQLRIISNATASKVLFKGKNAVGVEYILHDKGEKIVKVRGKNIILAAGAIQTPAILQRSGIGDSTLLNSLGIKVIVDNPNVGANLQNQYGVRGIIAGVSTGGFMSFIDMTTPGGNTREVQVFAIPVSATVSELIGFITEPSSRGSVNIVSTNPLTLPQVNLNMYSDGPYTTVGTDAWFNVNFYKVIRNTATLSGGTLLFPPASDFASDALLFEDAKTYNGLEIADHIVGTTRMSTSMADGVVDGNLNVFGVKNLKVANIGISPTTENGNTGYSGYVIGLNAARIIEAEAHSGSH